MRFHNQPYPRKFDEGGQGGQTYVYALYAPTEAERRQWVEVIRHMRENLSSKFRRPRAPPKLSAPRTTVAYTSIEEPAPVQAPAPAPAPAPRPDPGAAVRQRSTGRRGVMGRAMRGYNEPDNKGVSFSQ
jgi:hypothetical protein